jgi:polysaccharide biosynthesis/export protein
MLKVKSHLPAFPILAALALCVSVAGGQSKRDLTRPQAAAPPNSIAPSESSLAAVDPNKYLIGPEDILYIKTWREPDFTGLFPVRPDGKITLSLIGEIQAGGQTPIQLAKTLTDSLGKLLVNPDVNVAVQEVRSKKFYIDGEVNRPGSFPLVTPTTILEALSHAGGFKEFANTKHIRILRGGTVFKFSYNEVTHGKHLEQNITVENGDHIIVP